MTECKEAVRADWLDGKTHRDPKWPVSGYAPGNYISKCSSCGGQFINMDKRAVYCFPCAVEALQASHEELRLRLRAVSEERDTLSAAFQIVARPTTGEGQNE